MARGKSSLPGGITPRQRQWLRAVVRLTLEHGRPPTFRELKDWLGIKSLNGVGTNMRALARKGLVTYGDEATTRKVAAVGLVVGFDQGEAGRRLKEALGEGEGDAQG
jgi:SOS-response transcriptional repressor LexA